jgi:hypothetical protein
LVTLYSAFSWQVQYVLILLFHFGGRRSIWWTSPFFCGRRSIWWTSSSSIVPLFMADALFVEPPVPFFVAGAVFGGPILPCFVAGARNLKGQVAKRVAKP